MYPDNKVYGVNMGPTWDRQDPGGPHVGPMNFAFCVCSCLQSFILYTANIFSVDTINTWWHLDHLRAHIIGMISLHQDLSIINLCYYE